MTFVESEKNKIVVYTFVQEFVNSRTCNTVFRFKCSVWTATSFDSAVYGPLCPAVRRLGRLKLNNLHIFPL